MSTHSAIGTNYIGNRSSLSASVRQQLEILEHYLYYLGNGGKGNPFDLASFCPIHGIVATNALIANPDYYPAEHGAYFFTEFEANELKIKAIEKSYVWQAFDNGTRGNLQRTTVLIHGTFNNFDTMQIVDGVRSITQTETISLFIVLLGEFDSLFNCGTNTSYLPTPALPSDGITANNYGWGSDNTVPYIAPRRLRIKQWGFNVDVKTVKPETKRV